MSDKQEFLKTVKDGFESIEEKKIMTLAEQWKQEGYKKGIKEGGEEGGEEEKIIIARAMIAKGLDLDVISIITGFSSKELK